MTYEERLKEMQQGIVELATSPTIPTEQLVADLLALRRELEIQIAALQTEAQQDGAPDETEGDT